MKKGKTKAPPLERLLASNNFDLPASVKKALGAGQYGYEKGGTQIDETVVQHLSQLSPHVSKLAKMEVEAQNIWLTMALTFGSRDRERSDIAMHTTYINKSRTHNIQKGKGHPKGQDKYNNKRKK